MSFTRMLTGAATMATATLAAGSALALSCLPPSIETSFERWQDAPERYYVVSGTLTPAAPLPRIPSLAETNGIGVDTSNLRGVYRVQGEVVYANQTVPIDHYVWVRVTCAGPWCGSFPAAGTSGVMAFEQLPDMTLELTAGACPGAIFSDPGGATAARVQQCLRGEDCSPPVPFR